MAARTSSWTSWGYCASSSASVARKCFPRRRAMEMRAYPYFHGARSAAARTTRGVRSHWGSKIGADHVADEDARIVQRLKAAGAIVIGKTNPPEFAAGAHTFNALFGPTRNPWNVALSAGGSSGGAAVAVATGMS